MTVRPIVYVDLESTGLDPNIHAAYEVAWAVGDGPIARWELPHTLDHADPFSLKVGRYFERGFHPMPRDRAHWRLGELARTLDGATLCGANPAFDAAFLRKAIGCAPWHHRLLDVEVMAMVVFGLDDVPGLAQVRDTLAEVGIEVPEPDHTAAGDVATTRAVHRALDRLRRGWEPPGTLTAGRTVEDVELPDPVGCGHVMHSDCGERPPVMDVTKGAST